MAKILPLDKFGPRLDAEGWEKVRRYTPLALSIARTTRRPVVMDSDILRNIAFDGLIEAVATHDPARSKLVIWIRKIVKWRIAETIGATRGNRRFKWESGHHRLDAAIRSSMIVFDAEPDPDALIAILFAGLPPRDAEIVREWAIEGKKMREIAARHGMVKSNVSRICRSWLAVLKGHPAALAATAN